MKIRSKLLPENQHAFTSKEESLEEALEAISAACVRAPRQVHGDQVLVVGGDALVPQSLPEGRIHWQGQGDAILTRQAGQALGVRCADCVPVLIWLRHALAGALHLGWRSAAQDLAAKTLSFVKRKWKIAPAKLCAAVGPAICQNCFQVGEEVIAAFSGFKELRENPALVLRPRSTRSKLHFDLRRFVYLRLRNLGLKKSNIDFVDYCTCCQTGMLHSHRRDGTPHRQWALIRL